MLGTLSEEIEVKVAASEAWKVYGTLELAKLVVEKLPHVLSNVELVHGDGGVGTILKLTLPQAPGTPTGVSSYKEKFTLVDDEKRVKEAEVVEGGYLNFGFDLYRVRFQVIENGENSCITRATIEYRLNPEVAAADDAASMVTIQPLLTIMKAIADYLTSPPKPC